MMMEKFQYEIRYRISIKDGIFMETTTYVAATNRNIAIDKLKLWLETQEEDFDRIQFLKIDRVHNVVV